nr:leucine-rich repeat receptor-like serine/threonine/tyrosine-protein kinase SOBIR1 [Tanacetum cinerariifolium]
MFCSRVHSKKKRKGKGMKNKGVLVMGKFPPDAFLENTATDGLVIWTRGVMNSDNPREAIDPLLLDNGYEKQILFALKIACYCTLHNPKYRPDSKTCRIMLAEIKHSEIKHSDIEHSEIKNSEIENSKIEHSEIDVSEIALIS